MSENVKDALAFQWHKLSYLPKNSLVNDLGSHGTGKIQAPEPPKTPIKAILESIFTAFKI